MRSPWLMYLFSAKMKLPVYYRLVGGNIVDVAAMAVRGGDGGFRCGLYSRQRILQRGEYRHAGSSKPPVHHAGQAEQSYQASGHGFITYLDDRLRVEEEQDYLIRMKTHPDGYTEEGYQERLGRFGTLTLTYRINRRL
jgi:hypothetical protein